MISAESEEAPSREAMENFEKELKRLAPKAAILSSLSIMETATNSSIRVVRKLPPTLTSLYDPKFAIMDKDALKGTCKDIFERMSITNEAAEYLEESTRLQSQSTLA